MREEKVQQRNYYQQFSTQTFQTKQQQYYTQGNLQARNQFVERQIREIPRQPKYSINNLPIIYDNARTGTPKRSSRIVYASRQEYEQRQRTPSPIPYQGAKFNKGRQQIIRPLTPTKNGLQYEQPLRKQQNSPFGIKNSPNINQGSNPTARAIAGNVIEGIPEYKNYRVQASYEPELKMSPNRPQYQPKYQPQEQKQKQTSRILIQKNIASNIANILPPNFNPQGLQPIHIPPQNLPPGFGQRPVASYITSQIQLEPISGPQFQLKGHIVPPTNQPKYPQNINNSANRPQSVIYVNQPPQQMIPQKQRVINTVQYNSKSGLSTTPRQIPPAVLNQMNLQNPMQRQVLYQPQQMNPQNIGIRPAGLLSSETVPKIQFDKCITECKNWETKYNELYLKYMSLAASGMESNSVQIQNLRQQNYRLKRQLKEQRQRSAHIVPVLSSKFVQMVNNQRQATIRQCGLLLERYKLQAKQNKF